MFYFFYKIIIFVVNKEKDNIRSAYCKFSQLGDSQTTLLTPFSCYENTLVDQSKRTYYPKNFIILITYSVCKMLYQGIFSPPTIKFKYPRGILYHISSFPRLIYFYRVLPDGFVDGLDVSVIREVGDWVWGPSVSVDDIESFFVNKLFGIVENRFLHSHKSSQQKKRKLKRVVIAKRWGIFKIWLSNTFWTTTSRSRRVNFTNFPG